MNYGEFDVSVDREEMDTYEYIKQGYLELARKKDLDVREIWNFTNQFFKRKNQYDKAFGKRIFEVHIKPFRELSRYKEIKNHLLTFYAAAIYRHIVEDYDYIATFSALEGTGKSAASLFLANELTKLGMHFEMEEDIFFRGDANPSGFREVYKKIARREKSVIIFDEGKAFFDKRQSMNTERIETLQEIASQRSKNNVLLINVGDINEIDLYFRERRCRTIFALPDRRIVVTLMNRGVIGMGEDRFALGEFEWKIRKMRQIDWLGQLSALYSLPTQYGIGVVPLLPKEMYDRYLELKNARNSILDKEKERKFAKLEAKALGLRGKKLKEFVERNVVGERISDWTSTEGRSP